MKYGINLCLLSLLTLAVLSSCTPGISTQELPENKLTPPISKEMKEKCGDGICEGPENSQICLKDCPSSKPAIFEPVAPSIAKTVSSDTAPLYLTTMTHMESNSTDDRDQAVFLRHVELMRFGISLAREYGAKLTIESELPFALACDKWEVNILKEIVDQGMGVGTHSDLGFKDNFSIDQFARELVKRKEAVDRLVGAQNNRGTSGAGSAVDWVLAATQAGFNYMDGIVGMHYLSMPMENRPGPEWTDDYIRNTTFHDGAPVDLYERISPILMKDAKDFRNDPDGTILVISGEIGRLDSMAEGDGKNCPKGNCPLTNADVDTLVQMIIEINQNRDPNRIAKLTLYFPLDNFVATNEQVLSYFFSKMQELQNNGLIVWATQGEVYDAYMASIAK
jgi:hypothetical protein